MNGEQVRLNEELRAPANDLSFVGKGATSDNSLWLRQSDKSVDCDAKSAKPHPTFFIAKDCELACKGEQDAAISLQRRDIFILHSSLKKDAQQASFFTRVLNSPLGPVLLLWLQGKVLTERL